MLLGGPLDNWLRKDVTDMLHPCSIGAAPADHTVDFRHSQLVGQEITKIGKKKRGRKNTRAKEDDEFLTNSCEQFEIVKKGVEDRGKKAREPNQAFQSLMFQFPPDMLKTKLKDLSVEPSENVTNQCREKGPGVTQGSPGRIISFESRCTPGVPHTGSLLQVATESNMLKVAGANSVTKFIRTPSASGVSPVGILRIPEPGEYVVSANGSPLIVTSSVPDTVNINIPLKNGKKITILPNADVNPNAIHDYLDDDVKAQLKLLKNTLFQILKEE